MAVVNADADPAEVRLLVQDEIRRALEEYGGDESYLFLRASQLTALYAEAMAQASAWRGEAVRRMQARGMTLAQVADAVLISKQTAGRLSLGKPPTE